MNQGKPDLDSVLAGSARALRSSAAIDAAMNAVADQTAVRGAHVERVKRRRRWLVPTVVVGTAILTAGGLMLGQRLDPDVHIPIKYTTRTGTNVQCTVLLKVSTDLGSGTVNLEAREWLIAQDWTGVGQRIYDDAIENPFIPPADAEMSEEMTDFLSWSDARDRQTIGQLPEELLGDIGWSVEGDSSCKGQLR